jgi:hypothetical protein
MLSLGLVCFSLNVHIGLYVSIYPLVHSLDIQPQLFTLRARTVRVLLMAVCLTQGMRRQEELSRFLGFKISE